MALTIAQRFDKKIILVTGGNSGIGLATAKRLASEGAHVIITGRNRETLDAAKKEIGAACEAIVSDVGDLKQINTLFEDIKKKHSKIDGVFANAGVAEFKPSSEVTEADYDRIFDINVKGVYFTLQKAVPLLNPGSAVVITASVVATRGNPGTSVYSASKAAVRSLARTFSAENVEKKIRFNVVSPGPIETPIWGRDVPQAVIDATKIRVTNTNPMKRYGTSEEVANIAAFLLSAESSYVLGAEFLVDGGANQI